MTGKIRIRDATANNLKGINVDIPLNKLVAIVGKSGSGKSSLVYDVIYRASQGYKVDAEVSNLPRVFAVNQKIKPAGKLSLLETNMKKLEDSLNKIEKGGLLIVDEPCAGMAKADRDNILRVLRKTVSRNISVIAVEHNKDIIRNVDYVIEFGPGAGTDGGEIIFEGPIEKFKKAGTLTSAYAFSKKAEITDYVRSPNKKARVMQRKTLTINGITKHSLDNYNLSFPLGSLVCISGRMGSGKSTLLSVVYGALFKGANAWRLRDGFKLIQGKENVRRSFFVDQTPLSAASTSTPATYLGIWDSIRGVFSALPESKRLKLNKSNFSFNVRQDEDASNKINRVKFKGKTVYDVLNMTVDEALNLFKGNSLVSRKLGFLAEAGLGYLILGQKSGTLSGGEAQRVRLAKILSKKLADRCIYILDTPSRGLHLSDLPTLVKIFQKITDKNNTVLIADNCEELIKNCDFAVNL